MEAMELQHSTQANGRPHGRPRRRSDKASARLAEVRISTLCGGELPAYLATLQGRGHGQGCGDPRLRRIGQDVWRRPDWLASEGYLAAAPDLSAAVVGD
jgi:hypothetical protein